MRRIPLSRRSHIIGFQPLTTGIAEHESALERDFVTLTSFLHPAASITSQPITLSFRDCAIQRRYTPDFLVQHRTGRQDLIEVKYRADLRRNWARLRPAFVRAREWAREHGAVFRIANEHNIRGPTLDNAKRLLPLRPAPVDPEVRDLILTAVRAMGSPSFGGVLASVPLNRQVTLAAVWRLIAQGALRVDLSASITFDTGVSAV